MLGGLMIPAKFLPALQLPMLTAGQASAVSFVVVARLVGHPDAALVRMLRADGVAIAFMLAGTAAYVWGKSRS